MAGYLLVICTILSLVLANIGGLGDAYLSFWTSSFCGHPVSHWIDEGLMSIFFLLVGLEIKREMLTGELRSLKRSALPLAAALGGMLVPAAIYLTINAGRPTLGGFGIPMSTDIAFVVGILALLGSRVPPALKVFLTTLAVIDDIGAIVVIAIFYTASVNYLFLLASFAVFGVMLLLNMLWKVDKTWIYLLLGVLMWVLVIESGVHATLAGIMVAAAIPFRKEREDHPAARLEKNLHKPVYFFVLPLFVLSNTAIVGGTEVLPMLTQPHAVGITSGLLIGKPVGILLATWLALKLGWAELPERLKTRHLIGAGFLSGIGFTMSIFVTTLSFDNILLVDSAKLAILFSSVVAAVLGSIILLKTKNEAR